MWLLSTNRAELHRFADHTVVQGGYAILSHTWGLKEQTLQDLQDINERCQRDGKNPRDCVSEKIRGSCILAENDGYEWIWIDSCCIDKTSSSELSEAINSMFEWYLRSEVCYALLEDVSSNCDLHAPESDFRKARWHTRGWTLQELIAPSTIIFISKDWQFLGTKLELADLLHEVTGVWSQILTHQTHYSTLSVARRMSWASRRKTTRVEDEAYCLMGLFGVNMPTIYGEGRQAFQRLQEEILKRTPDMSLFAWGTAQELESLGKPVMHTQMSNIGAFMQTHISLFANSPEAFSEPSYVAYAPMLKNPLQPYLPWQWKERHNEPKDSSRRTHGPFGELELPKITSMSNEVQCRLPILDIDGITVAILLCDDHQTHIGLLLHRSPKLVQDPKRPLYRAGSGFHTNHGSVHVQRLITLGNDYYNMTFRGKKVTAEWQDVSIEQNDSYQNSRHLITINGRLNDLSRSSHSPFHVSTWLLTRFQALEFDVFSISMEGQSTGPGRPLALLCTNWARHESLTFILGTCKDFPSAENVQEEPKLPHWARVHIQHPGNWASEPSDATSHNCSEDHITDWRDWSKAFGDDDRTVRLSFRRWITIPSADILVMDVDLDGHFYRQTSRVLNVSLPSLARSRAAESLPHSPMHVTPSSEYKICSPDGSSKTPSTPQNRGTLELLDSSAQVTPVREPGASKLSVETPTQFTPPREPHSSVSSETVESSTQDSALPSKSTFISHVWNVLAAMAVSFSG